MPSNFTAVVPTPPVGDATRVFSNDDPSPGIVAWAGEKVSALGGMFKKENEEDALGALNAELADVEAGLVGYGDTVSNIIAQMQEADGETFGKLYTEYNAIKRGEAQGVYSPSAARLKALALQKKYSTWHPGLAKDIRTLTNQATGNFREIMAETTEGDPFTKMYVERLNEATARGYTPKEARDYLNAQDRASAIQAQADMDAKTRGLSKEAAGSYAGSLGNAMAANAVYETYNTVKNAMISGQQLNDFDIERIVANAQAGVESSVMDFYKDKELKGGFVFSTSEKESILFETRQRFDRFKTILLNSDTLQNRLKNLEGMMKIEDAENALEFFKTNGELAGYLDTLNRIYGKEGTGIVISSYTRAKGIADGLSQTHSKKQIAEQLKGQIAAQERLGNYREAMGIQMYLDGGYDRLIGQSIAEALSGRQIDTGNTAADAAAAKGVRDTYAATPSSERMRFTDGILQAYTWDQLRRDKVLQGDIKQNPGQLSLALSKATLYAAQYLGDPTGVDAVDFDVTRVSQGKAPFQYINPVGISSERIKNLEKVNETFYFIRDTFGADTAEQWVNALVDIGVSNPTGVGLQGAYGTKKKVTETSEPQASTSKGEFSTAPDNLRPVIRQAEAANQVPMGLVEAVAWVESRYNPKAQGPLLDKGDRASGIMQIRPTAHPGVNYFDANESLDYGARYLRQMYDQFGDWRKALAAYNWGPGNVEKIADKSDWWERLPSEVRDYVNKVANAQRTASEA